MIEEEYWHLIAKKPSAQLHRSLKPPENSEHSQEHQKKIHFGRSKLLCFLQPLSNFTLQWDAFVYITGCVLIGSSWGETFCFAVPVAGTVTSPPQHPVCFPLPFVPFLTPKLLVEALTGFCGTCLHSSLNAYSCMTANPSLSLFLVLSNIHLPHNCLPFSLVCPAVSSHRSSAAAP